MKSTVEKWDSMRTRIIIYLAVAFSIAGMFGVLANVTTNQQLALINAQQSQINSLYDINRNKNHIITKFSEEIKVWREKMGDEVDTLGRSLPIYYY